jgi:hypothetical protein
VRNTITKARAVAVLGAGALVLAACQGPAATSATTSATGRPASAGVLGAGSAAPTGDHAATVPPAATATPPASAGATSTLSDPSTDEDMATLQSALAGLDADLSQSAADLTDTQGDS